MENSKHTQGKWFHFKMNSYQSIRTEKELITEYNGSEANAKLIAAAPDTIQALDTLIKRLEKHWDLITSGTQNGILTSLIEEGKQTIEKATK